MRRTRLSSLLAIIVALFATLSSGGGMARFVHVMAAHSGTACGGATPCAAMPLILSCSLHRHDASSAVRPAHDERETAPAHPDAPSPAHPDACAVCAELAVQLLSPVPVNAGLDAVEILAAIHTSESAQLPAPLAPDAVAARPPPHAI